MQIERILEAQRRFFGIGKTINVGFRTRMLTRLEKAIVKYEDDLCTAIKSDLGKSRPEAYMCQIGMTLSELRYMRSHVRGWSRDIPRDGKADPRGISGTVCCGGGRRQRRKPESAGTEI